MLIDALEDKSLTLTGYLAGFCMAWSIVSLLTFLAHDFGSMMALRFLLGLTEAPV